MFDDTKTNEIGLITQQIAERLKHRKETISIAESSTGGLISASLLTTPGASAFFLGGTVVYTLASRRAFLDIDKARVKGLKIGSEERKAWWKKQLKILDLNVEKRNKEVELKTTQEDGLSDIIVKNPKKT